MRCHSAFSPVLALSRRRIAAFFCGLACAVVAFGCSDSTVTSPQPHQRALAMTSAFPLTLSVLDSIGDQTGPVDVAKMVMNFDNATGQYEVVITADPMHPFVGAFRININLFNSDAASIDSNTSFFSDAVNDFALTTPTTIITLTGTHSSLLGWNSGHRVFTNSLAGTGNPPGISLFRSSVLGFPFTFLTNEDVIAFPNLALPAIIQSAASAVIEVDIDIKPKRFPNVVQVGGRANIEVAILTTSAFDATTVDPLSVKFGPAGARELHNKGHFTDVNGDGDVDMVLHFSTQASGIALGDTRACLTGQTTGGVSFRGCDSILTRVDR